MTRLVAVQDAEAESPAETPSVDELPADRTPDAPAGADGDAPDSSAADPPPPAETTGDAILDFEASAADPRPATATEAASQTLAEAAAATAVDTGTAPGQVRPLAAVRDDILQKLAEPFARERIDVALATVRSAMNQFTLSYIDWDMDRQAKKPTGELKRIDLAEIAQQQGLEYGSIPLSDIVEIQQHELGQAFNFGGFTMQGLVQRISFAQIAFDPQLGLFVPKDIQGAEAGAEFVFWKTDEQPERVPELDEVRDTVIAAIKLREARKIAQDFAQRDAEAVRTAAKPLSEVFGTTRTVTPTGEFTWLTIGNVPLGNALPRLSQVPGVERAGSDFMQAVFSAEPGEVVVVANQPQSIYYVVQIQRRTIEPDQLRQQFLQNALSYMPLRIMTQRDRNAVFNDWLAHFERQRHVEWRRPPTDTRASS
jgi:hypothetical protein